MAVVADSRAERLPCADVAKHNTKANHWIVMHNLVLDVPRHMLLHPSGKRILFDYADEDSVKGF
ncbi:cytochrome b5-like protein [Leishmania major strain Friedlin]|uniref:Cytochrome b5-like protein n=3 Tax=Leishmania TaxID=38568 RepID=Q4QIK6_LEIMA|nr:cytochrome b5-like protein [Leishmania major strain Friedlin]CAG9569024.1 cytochrome_b5-like_protein [Leishmania major strain Friedlin]CAJ07047.1 cytochrome b5-like protein [Leishmania major strain Friedlin]|eukprot:XP_001680992.1 cytochrome b5-like protein [Leishmania major strain Friedlin]